MLNDQLKFEVSTDQLVEVIKALPGGADLIEKAVLILRVQALEQELTQQKTLTDALTAQLRGDEANVTKKKHTGRDEAPSTDSTR